MSGTTHLKSLQALDAALQEGSLQGAARKLGITPAAVGQRIRSLEEYLGTDLLVRGRSGLQPTAALAPALGDLRDGFAALDRTAHKLEFQRSFEIHLVADPDWCDLWLLPRLASFCEQHPRILFNINGVGDIPARPGAADCFIDRDPEERAMEGELLYRECFLPVCTPDNKARLDVNSDPRHGGGSPKYLPTGALNDTERLWRHSAKSGLEGFPLLHVQPSKVPTPGWPEWVAAFAYPRSAPDRGVRYAHMRNAIEGARSNAGLLVCGLSLALHDVDAGTLCLPFPPSQHLPAGSDYHVRFRPDARLRPQIQRFREWLLSQSRVTRERMAEMIAART